MLSSVAFTVQIVSFPSAAPPVSPPSRPPIPITLANSPNRIPNPRGRAGGGTLAVHLIYFEQYGVRYAVKGELEIVEIKLRLQIRLEISNSIVEDNVWPFEIRTNLR